MKKSRRILIALITCLTVLCVLLSFTACSNNSSSSGNYENGVDGDDSESDSGDSAIVTTTDRMIVYYVDMNLTVKDISDASSAADSKCKELGGYIQESYASSSGYTKIVYRVPTEQLDAFVGSLKDSGKVNNLDITSEDITDTYTTVAARKEALVAQKAALEAMLARTDLTISEELEINSQLYDVSRQIDNYSTKLSSLKKKSDYSTVTVGFYEEGVYEEPNFWDKLGDVFMGSGASVGKVLGWLLIAIVAVLPYFALIAGIFGLYVLIKFIVCKATKKPFTLFRNAKLRRAERKARREYYQTRLNGLTSAAKAADAPVVAANNSANAKTEEKNTEENKDDGNKQ
jgi:hypothetical protein